MSHTAGEYVAVLHGGPSRHCQWSYFMRNPRGGGGGSNAGAACKHGGGPGVTLCPLHAAAPEMLALVRCLARYGEMPVVAWSDAVVEARALLAKIEGR